MSDFQTNPQANLHPVAASANPSPVINTGLPTPSIDFNPSDFKSTSGSVPSDAGAHSNPHPVVAKSGIDLSTGVARPAETHANSGTFSSTSPASGSTGTGTGSVADKVEPTVTGLRQRAGSISETVGAKVNAVGSNVGASLNSAGKTVGTQFEHAAEHPAVQNAKQAALKQADSFREVLGRYPIIVDAEKRTNVDRVVLVLGGVFLYLLLIPLNLFGLALPTTQLLTFLPPTFLALRTLDNPNEERTKTLLSYFVVFGFVQFAESLMAGFLERKIPQYYTVKLLFLAYLIHPKTKGARKIHSSVLRPLLIRAQQAQKPHSTPLTTPPTTKPSSGSGLNSPAFTSSSIGAGADVPISHTSGFSTAGTTAPVPASAFSGQTQAALAFAGQAQAVGHGGQVHLPSGGGNGVGQEVPKY